MGCAWYHLLPDLTTTFTTGLISDRVTTGFQLGVQGIELRPGFAAQHCGRRAGCAVSCASSQVRARGFLTSCSHDVPFQRRNPHDGFPRRSRAGLAPLPCTDHRRRTRGADPASNPAASGCHHCRPHLCDVNACRSSSGAPQRSAARTLLERPSSGGTAPHDTGRRRSPRLHCAPICAGLA